MHDIRRFVILGVRRDNPGPDVRLLKHLSEGRGGEGGRGRRGFGLDEPTQLPTKSNQN
jgi:hypothetical protein